jgi:hypothetical protein
VERAIVHAVGDEAASAVRLPTAGRAGSGGSRLARAVAALAEPVAEAVAPADVVHALDVVSGAAALRARRETGTPVVVRLQGAARMQRAKDRRGLTPAERTGHDLAAVVARAADVVVVPSEPDARAAYALGATPGRVVVCPDAALLAADLCPASEIACAPSASGGAAVPYLLGLSGAPESPEVRTSLLTSLVASPHLHLVVASPDDSDLPSRNRMQEAARRLGVLERVHLVGRVSCQRVVELVDEACAVVATRSDPTCALSALVAMRRGRPVVAVSSAGADEVLVDGVTGLLAGGSAGRPLADALHLAATDRFRRFAWGAAGRDRALSRYAPELVGSTVVSAYDRAVA